jgi:hypothetical protein
VERFAGNSEEFLMDRNQVRFALLKISLAVLAGTTWVFSSFIFATRPERTGTDALSSLVRLPASLPTQLPNALPSMGLLQPTTKPLPAIRMDAMAVPCWDKVEKSDMETSSRWVRLTGKACQTVAALDGVTVQNMANGYMATVFAPAEGELTTDFIPLNEGKNEIRIRFATEPGAQLESRFTLTRE